MKHKANPKALVPAALAGLVLSVVLAAVLFVPCAPYAAAQGVPASVSSYNFGGVRGPRGFAPSVTSPGFGQPAGGRAFGAFDDDRRIRRGNGAAAGYPFGYPVYYVPGYPSISEPYLGYTPSGVQVDESGAIVPVTEAPRYSRTEVRALRQYEALLRDEIADEEARLHKKRASEIEAEAGPLPQAAAPGPQPASVLVFADGHQSEVSNYAIVGDTLFDLSTPTKPRKVALAELNVPATVKANDERGLDFQLPKLPPQ